MTGTMPHTLYGRSRLILACVMRIGPIISPSLQMQKLRLGKTKGLAQSSPLEIADLGCQSWQTVRWKNGIQIIFKKKEKDRSVCPQLPGHLCTLKAAHCPPAPTQQIHSQPLRPNRRILWIGFFSERCQPPGLRRSGLFALDHRELLWLALTGFPVTGKEWCHGVGPGWKTGLTVRNVWNSPSILPAPDRPLWLYRESQPHTPCHTPSPSPLRLCPSASPMTERTKAGAILRQNFPRELRAAPPLQSTSLVWFGRTDGAFCLRRFCRGLLEASWQVTRCITLNTPQGHSSIC